MADQPDWGQTEAQLKEKAGQWYDPSMLQDVQRNASYGAGAGANNVDDWTSRIANKAQLRGSNEANSTYETNGQGGVTVGPTGKVNNPMGGPLGNTSGSSGGGGGGGVPNTGGIGWDQYKWNDPFGGQRDDLFKALSQRMGQSLNVDPNDPIIANQVGAYKAQTDRGNQQALDALAERRGPNANMGTEARMMAESASQGAGGLRASLVGNELAQRRNEIQNSLSQMGGMLTQEQQISLQGQMQAIDAAMKQRGFDIQSQLGNRGMDINRELGLGQLGLGWGQLGSQNDQYANNFGANRTDEAWRQDRINKGLPVV